MSSTYRWLNRLLRPRRATAPQPARPRTVRLQIEPLEDRALPSTAFGLTVPNPIGMQGLVRFDTATPGTVTTMGTVTGLIGGAGETLVGLDFRPANNALYAVGNAGGTGRLYVINTITAVATAVSTTTTFALAGTAFGVDFNPTNDRFRVVSNTGQNLRIVPDTAVATTDTTLAFTAGDPSAGSTPNVAASGYTNNFAGATSTILYGIDTNLDRLVIQGVAPTGPNGGVLVTQGALGFDTTDQVGFDITSSNVAFASLTSTALGTTNSTLVRINLATGLVTTVGTIGGATTGILQGLALVPETPPAPVPPPVAGPGIAAVQNFFMLSFSLFQGDVRFAFGDFNGDQVLDVVMAGSRGQAGFVITLDGSTGSVVGAFPAYESGYRGGVQVIAADVTGDGRAEVITFRLQGRQDVRIFSSTGQRLA